MKIIINLQITIATNVETVKVRVKIDHIRFRIFPIPNTTIGMANSNILFIGNAITFENVSSSNLSLKRNKEPIPVNNTTGPTKDFVPDRLKVDFNIDMEIYVSTVIIMKSESTQSASKIDSILSIVSNIEMFFTTTKKGSDKCSVIVEPSAPIVINKISILTTTIRSNPCNPNFFTFSLSFILSPKKKTYKK